MNYEKDLSFICMFDSMYMKYPSKTVGTKQIQGEECLAARLAERLDFSFLIQMFWLQEALAESAKLICDLGVKGET